MEQNPTYLDVVTRLRNQAFELGMSYRVIAERSGVSIATVKRFLSGDNSNTDFMNVVNIAQAMGMNLNIIEEISPQKMREDQIHNRTMQAVVASAATNALEGQGPDLAGKQLMFGSLMKEYSSKSPNALWRTPGSSLKNALLRGLKDDV